MTNFRVLRPVTDATRFLKEIKHLSFEIDRMRRIFEIVPLITKLDYYDI